MVSASQKKLQLVAVGVPDRVLGKGPSSHAAVSTLLRRASPERMNLCWHLSLSLTGMGNGSTTTATTIAVPPSEIYCHVTTAGSSLFLSSSPMTAMCAIATVVVSGSVCHHCPMSDLPGTLIFTCCHHPGLPKILITIRTRPCLTAVECTNPRTDHRQRHTRQRNCNMRCGAQKCTQRSVHTGTWCSRAESEEQSWYGRGEQGWAQVSGMFCFRPTGQEKGNHLPPVMCFSALAISENYEVILARCGRGLP